ncbi:Ubiquitin fusion degradation protein 4 [Lambiella insularis]|nr:Ubiquitin fusion degradation protein 4 [Lambiella insularis]
MSSRVTRSAARLAADNSTAAGPATAASIIVSGAVQPPANSLKRKASARAKGPESPPEPLRTVPARLAKKSRIEDAEPILSAKTPAARSRGKKAKPPAVMSTSGPSTEEAADSNASHPAPQTASSKRKSNRIKKESQNTTPSGPAVSGRRMKKAAAKKSEDVTMQDAEDNSRDAAEKTGSSEMEQNMSDEDGDSPRGYDEQEDEDGSDPFRGDFGGNHPRNIPDYPSLRMVPGGMSNLSTASQLRDCLDGLRNKDNPTTQLVALNTLSNLLLISTEDNLSGHFSPDQFVKELVALMQPSEDDFQNPDMTLLACRCIANLMEALPPATANVVYGGAVPVLCEKLDALNCIEVIETALSALEKISVEFPASIVREGGLVACLKHLPFYTTATQRTAVTTAANCCRNIPEDSFPAVQGVMTQLLETLGSSDQRVVEQGSRCVSQIVESFKYEQTKLEELVSSELLKAILRLLFPGTTNLIGPNTHTQFLKLLATTARASPSLSAELFKMDVVDTLYQILTGVSPPSGVGDVASEIDGVVIMQALIHRPREQIYETLNLICELLPGVSTEGLSMQDELLDSGYIGDEMVTVAHARSRRSPNTKRIELLKGCKEEVKRFATILLPTLTHAYSSTVNLSVRQKVLTAQLKMISNLDTSILENALRTVPYASYLASILSQQDHPALVVFALQAAELLLLRLESIYRYQFYREGVISEISRLAAQSRNVTEEKSQAIKIEPDTESTPLAEPVLEGTKSRAPFDAKNLESGRSDDDESQEDNEEEHPDDENDENDDEDEDGDDREDDEHRVIDEVSPSPSTSSSSERNYPPQPLANSLQDYVILRAKKFLEVHESAKGTEMRVKAAAIMDDVKSLANDLRTCYFDNRSSDGLRLFTQLSKYFSTDNLESITSAELLGSDVVNVLLEIFGNSKDRISSQARSIFLEVFMGTSCTSQAKPASSVPTTPFSVLIHKLQDLLSRSEHFEVITVHNNSYDSNRSSAASMLAKQLRLKLMADDDSEIPRPYRNIMVSIHAIATFKALDDYLRPRISLSERPRGGRHHEGVANALAAFAAVQGIANPHQRLVDRGLFSISDAPTLPIPSATNSRPSKTSRKLFKGKPATPASALAAETPTANSKPTATRRSSRRHQPSTQTPAATPVQTDSAQAQGQLECADERQISEDEPMDDQSALDDFVNDLEGEMDSEQLADPTAVNLEVASTGKITARGEDGTRVPTPSQGSLASISQVPATTRSKTPLSTPSTGRALSYAAAIQAVPQDWHIEFSIDDQPIANETTIYRAVHYNNQNASEDTSNRTFWNAVHSIKFKRVPGPPPAEPSSLTPPPEQTSGENSSSLPHSLHNNSVTSSILRLLAILHGLNANLDDVLDDERQNIKLNAEPVAQFVNTKLTAKLNRQLEEPLIVASNCLPGWSEDLARLYPFLFPFETRHLFLQSTSFGYSRSMTRWQNAQSTDDSRRDRHRDERPFLGRLQRQKVRISRTRILESAVKVMELYGASPSVLEVEYFEEVGTGLGPTLEFYSTVSKEFSKKKIKLWRENETSSKDDFAFGKLGLFPAPMSAGQAETENGKKVLHLFKMLGKFVARSMLDSRIIDISLNPTFFKIGVQSSTVPLSLGTVRSVDADLATSLKLLKQFASLKKVIDESTQLTPTQKALAASQVDIHGTRVEDLGLDFTLPGYPAIELIENGANIPVTIDNIGTYVEKVIDYTLGTGVQRQVDAFRAGFSRVFPYSALRSFTPAELVMLFGRVEEDWTIETLMDSIKADHGFNMDSKSVRNLLQTMSELSPAQRRDFLQFVTGSPKLPIGGFKSLTPMFTVVCKPSEPPYTSDDYLPSVMTCVNYLKLPDYTDLDVMRKRLYTAIREGQGAFHLS